MLKAPKASLLMCEWVRHSAKRVKVYNNLLSPLLSILMKRRYDTLLLHRLRNIADVGNLGGRRIVLSFWQALLLCFRDLCSENYPRDSTRSTELLFGIGCIRQFTAKCKEHFLSSCTLTDDPASMRVKSMLQSGNWPTADDILQSNP